MDPPATPTQADAVPSFVQSLHTMLQNEDSSIIRWTPDGHAFEILDQRMLAARVLHRYFRHTKYASFQRQLNYFGFRKWPKQKAAICTYSQLHFSRDSPEDLHRIKRRVKALALDAALQPTAPLDCAREASDSLHPATCPDFLPSDEDLHSLETALANAPDNSHSDDMDLSTSPPPTAITAKVECPMKEDAVLERTLEPKCEPSPAGEPMTWHHALWASDWLSAIDPHDVERVMGDPYLWLGSL